MLVSASANGENQYLNSSNYAINVSPFNINLAYDGFSENSRPYGTSI